MATINVQRALYSWNNNKEIRVNFTIWIFWVLASRYFYAAKNVITPHDIKVTIDFLTDKKLLNIINCHVDNTEINFRELLDFILYPGTHNTVLLPSRKGARRLEWIEITV